MATILAWFWFGGVSMADNVVTTADGLKTAILNASSGDTIILSWNIEITEPIVITKSLTIDWWGNTIWYQEKPKTWDSLGNNYVFKIWSSDSESIDVKLNNITVQNSFYWILDWFTSSISTNVNLEDVIFSGILFWAIDLQNDKASLITKTVTIPENILSVNIDTYNSSNKYEISDDLKQNCYVNGSKYFCSASEETLNSAITDSSALNLPLIVAKIGSVYYWDLQKAIEAADEKDTVKIIIDQENAVIPENIDKSITIEAATGVKVTIKGNCTYDSDSFIDCRSKPITTIAEGKEVIFSGITFNLAWNESNYDNAHHNWIQWKGKLIMNNCTINWTLTTYGDSEFNNCNFTKVSGWYNIFGILWGETKFKNCSFSWKDRNINVYNSNESTSTQHVVFDNCKYNASKAPVKWAIVVHETADNTNTNKFKVEIVNYETSDLGKGYAWIKNVHAIWQEKGKNAFVKYLTGNWLIMFDDWRRDIPHEWWEITISINWWDPVYSTPKIESIPADEYNDKWLTITKNYYESLWKILSKTGVDTSKDGDLNKFYITNPIYSITLWNVTNWTISSNLLSAEEWTTVTLEATPNSNYNFSKWTVKSWDVEIKVENNQFTMPAANVTVSATFTAKPTTSWGGSSGWSSSSSSSKTTTTTDTKKAEETKTENKTSEEINLGWEVTEEQTSEKVEETTTPDNNYSKEFNDAYSFAHKNWITTMDSIGKADMNAPLTRIAMAKMLSQYAINVLGRTPDTTKVVPAFPDVSAELDAAYNSWVTLAYQLGIMWINIDKFRPDDLVTRAEFGTALSRMLYATADWENAYYETHLAKLMDEKIITVDTPDLQELRGYVMIMLMRSANK